jgi:hypothetical protein
MSQGADRDFACAEMITLWVNQAISRFDVVQEFGTIKRRLLRRYTRAAKP